MTPPLQGLKVVEFSGLAPGPFVGLMLADFGADVVRIDKVSDSFNSDTLSRGKRSIAVSPKSPQGLAVLRKLVSQADVLIDPFRPGVMERLGLGPQQVMEGKGEGCISNPKLVYARLTGFQRQGPYANMAGHDINYAALSGILSMLGTAGGPPQPPANLLADFAGGSQVCLQGILFALLARNNPNSPMSGKGQIVEADMVTGARYVATFQLMASYVEHPSWGATFGKGTEDTRGTGVLDGGSPWYGVYKTKDMLWMSIGAIEPQFYAEMLRILKEAASSSSIKTHPSPSTQLDRSTWPELQRYFTDVFALRTRDEWTKRFIGTDACVVPVLTRDEALLEGGVLPAVPEAQRETVLDGSEPIPPSPAPRLSVTPANIPAGSAAALSQGREESAQLLLTPGEHTLEILEQWAKIPASEAKKLYQQKAIGAADVPDDWDSKL